LPGAAKNLTEIFGIAALAGEGAPLPYTPQP
jgi:hypothetical protein